MRDQTPFDIKAVMATLDRGFRCKSPDKGKKMIVAELLQQWPGDRRSHMKAEGVRYYAERRVITQGRAGDNDRRSKEDRRVA